MQKYERALKINYDEDRVFGILNNGGDVNIVKYLIKRGVDVNQVDEAGDTPLSSCYGMEYGGGNGPRIAEILIKAGADPYFLCRYDDDPEDCHTFMGMINQYYDEMIKWLKKREKKNGRGK